MFPPERYVPDTPLNLALTLGSLIASGCRIAPHSQGPPNVPENYPFTTDEHDAAEMSAFFAEYVSVCAAGIRRTPPVQLPLTCRITNAPRSSLG